MASCRLLARPEGVFVLPRLRTGWYANTVTSKRLAAERDMAGELGNAQGSRNQATQDMENVTLNGPQCKIQNIPPSPEAVPRKQQAFFPLSRLRPTPPKRLRSRKADGQRPQRSGSPTRIPRTLAIQQLRPLPPPSERPRTARLASLGDDPQRSRHTG